TDWGCYHKSSDVPPDETCHERYDEAYGPTESALQAAAESPLALFFYAMPEALKDQTQPDESKVSERRNNVANPSGCELRCLLSPTSTCGLWKLSRHCSPVSEGPFRLERSVASCPGIVNELIHFTNNKEVRAQNNAPILEEQAPYMGNQAVCDLMCPDIVLPQVRSFILQHVRRHCTHMFEIVNIQD
ncbi:TPA: hypothetical protein N0F65_010714, partial [Lagenidium giganteum]